MPQSDLSPGFENEILGKPPKSIIRYGITVFFCLMLLFLILSWFFKYPDLIEASIEITSTHPPSEVKARSTGRIESLLVTDGEYVESNQYLAIIDNPVDYHNILDLKNYFFQLDTIIYHQEENIIYPGFSDQIQLNLGSLQLYYSLFSKNLIEINDFNRSMHFDQKIEALGKQLGDYQLYYNYLYQVRTTLEEDLLVAEKAYQRNESLFLNQTIAEAELEISHSAYLQKKYLFENARSDLANTNIQISRLRYNIIDMKQQAHSEKLFLFNKLLESYENFKSQIVIWEEKYILKATINGKVSFAKFWSENQNVRTDETVMTIISNEEGDLIGKMTMPAWRAGKVKAGQRVNIKLANYPYMEFGMVEGRISNISQVPVENNYMVEVSFPSGLLSTYGKELPFSQQMPGKAEIVTDNVRLLERIIQPFKSLLQNRADIKTKS